MRIKFGTWNSENKRKLFEIPIRTHKDTDYFNQSEILGLFFNLFLMHVVIMFWNAEYILRKSFETEWIKRISNGNPSLVFPGQSSVQQSQYISSTCDIVFTWVVLFITFNKPRLFHVDVFKDLENLISATYRTTF